MNIPQFAELCSYCNGKQPHPHNPKCTNCFGVHAGAPLPDGAVLMVSPCAIEGCRGKCNYSHKGSLVGPSAFRHIIWWFCSNIELGVWTHGHLHPFWAQYINPAVASGVFKKPDRVVVKRSQTPSFGDAEFSRQPNKSSNADTSVGTRKSGLKRARAYCPDEIFNDGQPLPEKNEIEGSVENAESGKVIHPQSTEEFLGLLFGGKL